MKATTKLRHSFSLNWIDTLDPDCYWTHPHGLERMILAFQFLVRTGAAISHPYGTSGPLDLLSKKPSCVNFSRVDPILSLDDLRSRFHWVLLCRMECAAVAKWKDANGIALDGMSRIPGRHFPPMNPEPSFRHEAHAQASFCELLATNKGKLNYSPNKSHPAARSIYGVEMLVHLDGSIDWMARYGYARDRLSWWYLSLAGQGERETPYQVLRRAIDRLEEVTE